MQRRGNCMSTNFFKEIKPWVLSHITVAVLNPIKKFCLYLFYITLVFFEANRNDLMISAMKQVQTTKAWVK